MATPVPWLKGNTLGVGSWIAHMEVELRRVIRKPAERIGLFKRFVQWFTFCIRQIQGSTRMVLAESGNCVNR